MAGLARNSKQKITCAVQFSKPGTGNDAELTAKSCRSYKTVRLLLYVARGGREGTDRSKLQGNALPLQGGNADPTARVNNQPFGAVRAALRAT